MPYAILRVAKLKTFGQIGGSLSHTFRTRDTPNADPARLHLNENHGPQTPAEIQAAFKEILPEKRRSDAVLGLEYLITFSPEFGQDGSKYFEDARRWLVDRHGAENVISTHVHRDETTPHMVAYVVPMQDGRLRSTAFIGGPQMLRDMQTDFAQAVGRAHGLERGIEGSKAKHQTISEYYARANEAPLQAKVEVPLEKEKRGLVGKESDAEFAQRVARVVHDKMIGGFVRGQELAPLKRQEREQARSASARQRSVDKLKGDLKAWDKATAGLTPAQVSVMQQAVAAKARQMALDAKRAAQNVIGHFIRWLDQDRFEVRDRASYLDQTIDAPNGAAVLRLEGVKEGDLVQVKGQNAELLQRAPEQTRGPDRGRGR
jgi:hypothetical protein